RGPLGRPFEPSTHQLGPRFEQLDPELGRERDHVANGCGVGHAWRHQPDAMRSGKRAAGQNGCMSSEGLRAAEEKMRAAGQPEEAIEAFRRSYHRVESGESAYLRSSELEPVEDVPKLDELPDTDARAALEHVVAIKLNGGLATTMGLRHPKSLVEAREGKTFLDIIIGQTLALRRRYGVRLPLVLMNSEATRADTDRALARHPELDVGLPLEFMQSVVPKLHAETLEPISW